MVKDTNLPGHSPQIHDVRKESKLANVNRRTLKIFVNKDETFNIVQSTVSGEKMQMCII